VVGLNGAGKTTLFNTISGFLPYAGDIRREGASLRGFTAATIARKGIVQCPEGRELFVDMTVRENLDLGGQHLSPAECAEQIAWLFDLFPILRDRQKQAAGTLSGAPKVRAMELIEEVEKTRRGLYGGVIGYLDFAGNADFAIAIRTALLRDGTAYVQAGGGVVADSNGPYEHTEATNKARAVLNAIAAAETLTAPNAPVDDAGRDG